MQGGVIDERFRRLAVAHRGRLFAYIFSRLPEREAAQELLDEVTESAAHQFATFVPGGDFFGWIRRIAASRLQARAGAPARARFGDELLGWLDADAQAIRHELDGQREALPACLEELSAGERELLRAHYGPEGGAAAAPRRLKRLRDRLLRCVERRLVWG